METVRKADATKTEFFDFRMEINKEVALATATADKLCKPFPHESNVFGSAHFPVDRSKHLGAPGGQGTGVQKDVQFLIENNFSHFSTTPFVTRIASSKRSARIWRRHKKRPGLIEKQCFCEAGFRAQRWKSHSWTLAAPHVATPKARKCCPFVGHSALFNGSKFSLRAGSSSPLGRAKAV